MIAADRRAYRFAPLDETGWLLGLQVPQCLILGAGLGIATLLLQVGAPPLGALAVLVGAIAASFVGIGGTRAYEWLPVAGRHVHGSITGASRWRRPIGRREATACEWPPALDGIQIIDLGPVPLADGPVAVGAVADRRHRSLSTTVRVRGRGFSLVERAEQERLVALWGDVLAGFCGERGEVSSVRVSEWSAPADLESHERFFAEHGASRGTGPAAEYQALLDAAEPRTVGHEALVTVTVDERRLRGRRGAAKAQAIADSTREQLRALIARLDAAGLHASPLDRADLASTLRSRLDPAAVRGGTRTAWRTLAGAAGIDAGHVVSPMALDTTWSNVRVDGSWHRAFWISDWPRLDVGPSWFEGLLLHAGGVRSIVLHYEPVPPSRARRRVDRDSTRLAADEEQRSRTGFRIGAAHRRAQAAVHEREAELVAGYAELDFVGFVVVSAPTEAELDRAAAEYEHAASQAGVNLRALDGRHDLGLVCSLPLGRGLATRRVAS